jgi:lysophospholipid acyltransferase (LPLAT)-like uncharacterized protein
MKSASEKPSAAGSSLSLGKRLVVSVVEKVFFALISVVGMTLRFEVEGKEYEEEASSAEGPPILAVWHDRIFAGVYFLRGKGLIVMVSRSLDGEYIARCIKRFGFGTARGSSTRGGMEALGEMVDLVQDGSPAAFTVDGPKGPRHVAKLGPCLLSKATGSPMLPFSVEVASFWEVNSWDRLQIPRPFSRARVFFAAPIVVPADADEAAIDTKRAELQAALDGLVDKGRAWRESVSRRIRD